MTDIFTGPIFLVGMPRSGTKLLRTLLNEHGHIAIPEVETHFIPYWFKNWQLYGDLSHPDAFSKFYNQAINLPYFKYLSEYKDIIKEQDWYDGCSDYSLSDVFEVLIRHDADLPGDSNLLWGDKTPSYIIHMPLLKELFPKARFIHIVRDVRDYCLSSKQAWGKNMYRAAQSWSERVRQACEYGVYLGDDYLLIKYENLLIQPETELRKICTHLDVLFESKMLTPSHVSENLGDTRGKSEIVTENSSKYLLRMGLNTRLKIESLTSEELSFLGYPVDYNGPVKRISSFMMFCYRLLDGVNLAKFELRNRGFIAAIKLRWKLFTTTSYGG